MVLDGYCSPQQGYHADRWNGQPGIQPELRGLLETLSEGIRDRVEAATSINLPEAIHTNIVARSFIFVNRVLLRKVGSELAIFQGTGRVKFGFITIHPQDFGNVPVHTKPLMNKCASILDP